MDSNSFLTYVDMIANDKDWHNDFVEGPNFFEINSNGVRGVYNLFQTEFYQHHNFVFNIDKVLGQRPVDGGKLLMRVFRDGTHINFAETGTSEFYHVSDFLDVDKMHRTTSQKKIDAYKALNSILDGINGKPASKQTTRFIKYYKNCVKELGDVDFSGRSKKVPFTEWKRVFNTLPHSALSFKPSSGGYPIHVDTLEQSGNPMTLEDFLILIQRRFNTVFPDSAYIKLADV